MSVEVYFHSLRGGRAYTPKTVKPIVLSMLRKSGLRGAFVDDWVERVEAKLRDERWTRFRNDMLVGAVVRDLVDTALGID